MNIIYKNVKLLLFIAICAIANVSFAQVSCTYQLQMFDSYGDGWNGAMLTILVDGVPTVYTVPTGYGANATINVSDGDALELSYTSGFYEGEVTYFLYDADGGLVFSAGPFPPVGDVFSGEANCPTCPTPSLSSVNITNITASGPTLNWTPISGITGTYTLEYGPQGFPVGNGLTVTSASPPVTLTGLNENVTYDVYISLDCGNGDSSNQIGPFTFQTPWNIDVGVAAISAPASTCGLGPSEIVTVTIKNFGAAPQSLIPFKYSVNGVEAGVPIPIDGFFTGILSNDSIVTIDFETTFDFSVPGEYVIKAWTEFTGDSDVVNDTTTTIVTSVPTIDMFPYFIGFEDGKGGWMAQASSTTTSGWEFGTPEGPSIIGAASGENCWTTNLDGPYDLGDTLYLYSPCLDFSGLSISPRITFALNYNTGLGYDGIWLEYSTDGGDTWATVGSVGTGINWYNGTSIFDNHGMWTGASNGWVFAQHPMPSLLGEANCKLRFVFRSAEFGFEGLDGVAIDNILISPPLSVDLAPTTIGHTSILECGDVEDQLTVTITNFGVQTQSAFDISYSVDGGPAVTENTGNFVLLPNQSGTYTFITPYNSTGGVHNIVVWTSLGNDLLMINDTLQGSTTTAIPQPLSLQEDFESTLFPANWTLSNSIFVTNQHNNTSYVMAVNLWSFNPTYEVTTNLIGPLNSGDSLTFDYRYSNYFDGTVGTVLSDADELNIQISSDCGLTYETVYTINSSNHITSNTMANVAVDLSDYAGQAIKIRFLGAWGQGDYWLDIDNVNILGCPVSLGLEADINDASGETAADGSASVNPQYGLAPYSYSWTNGSTDNEIQEVMPGIYTVTVIDAIGCSSVLDVTVGYTVGTFTPSMIQHLSLAPNPTLNTTVLKIELLQAQDIQVEMVNLIGQRLFSAATPNAIGAQYNLDLSDYPAGMYLVRVNAGGQTQLLKVVKE